MGDPGERQGSLLQRQIFVPDDRALKKALLHRFHDAPLAGHFGTERTLELIGRHYHWVGIEKDVAQYVKRCKECQWSHVKRHKPYGKHKSLETPDIPWTDLAMDFVTDLPPSKGRQGVYDAVLVIIDRFTKMALYVPTTKKATAEELADIFLERIIPLAGVPQSIISDRGPQFTSLLWQEFCVALQIKRKLSTAFHPQSDPAERQHQNLKDYLRIFCDEEQGNWARLLPMAEFAYNDSVHSATGETPFFLMYGFHPRASW
jgi:transposase InsO family protein